MENTVKRPATIDFSRPCRYTRPAPSLITPILNLSTPELSKMISGDELTVLTPNGISSVLPQANNNSNNVLPSPLIPTTVNSNNIINTTNNICNQNGNNTNNNNNDHDTGHKRSDKSSDIDVEKIEKKRERNRLAAKKCRQRKLETIDELRKTVSEWEQKYEKLELEYQMLRAQQNSKDKEIELLRHENSKLKEFNQTVM